MSAEYTSGPVPADAAIRPAGSIAMMISNAAMGVPVMLLGASIGSLYGGTTGWLVIGLGCAITAVLGALTAAAGVKSRRSTALLATKAFGPAGAIVFNLAVALALLGWFSVEMGFVGGMVAAGAKNVFEVSIGSAPGIIGASVIICAICVFGIALVSRAPLIFLPLLSVLLLAVLYLSLRATGSVAAAPVHPGTIGTGVSAIVGSYIIGCLIMPDYTRYVGTSRAAAGATIIALGPVYAIVLGTYSLAGLAAHSADPSTILLKIGLPTVVSLLLPIGLMQNGIMCLYSSSLATSTLFKSAPFRSIVMMLTVIGASIALAGAQTFFVNFLVALGIVFPPAAALLIFAGLVQAGKDEGKWPLRVPELLIWCFGIVCGASSEYIGIGVTGFSAFDGFLGGAAGSLMLHLVKKQRSHNFREQRSASM